MRWIRKQQPKELTEYHAKYQHEDYYGYRHLRSCDDVITKVENSLLKEQGWLCAYTGRSIGIGSFHVEHVKPQAFCTNRETVDYTNMVACYPDKGFKGKCPYGAHTKANWPSPDEIKDFVSPLDPSCEFRFHYKYSGRVDGNDDATQKTIAKLNLNEEDELVPLRRKAIRGALQPNGKLLTLKEAEGALERFKRPDGEKLPAFQFAIVQALKNHIATLKRST